MGQTPSREAIEAEKERREFQFKISTLFNKKVQGNEMDPSSVEKIFGNKPIFNKGVYHLYSCMFLLNHHDILLLFICFVILQIYLIYNELLKSQHFRNGWANYPTKKKP
jgi:hypothetical protein